MGCIYKNQPLRLYATVTDDGETLANPLTAAEYRYWKPGTAIDAAPDGTWVATILDEDLGTIEYNIDINVLDIIDTWRYQVYATSGGSQFPACSGNFKVKELGT